MVFGGGGKKLAPLVGSAALYARVAELADVRALDALAGDSVRVRVPPRVRDFVEGDVSVSDPS